MMTSKDLLDTMLGYLGFVVDIEETTNEGGNPTLQIYTEESRRLIGRNGETLEAIQFLLNRLLQGRDKNAEKVIVDCEHYRSMREDRIVQRVRELAERVRITGRSLQLEPMNSYERRLVHNAFKDDPEVATWSPSSSLLPVAALYERRKLGLPAWHSAVRDRCYSFHFERAASVAVPARTSGRHRNFFSSGLSFPSTASAMISPSTGANLNPCPLSPAATTNPSRSGSRVIQKCPSCVSQYMHTRV
jgi:spoIIIJ-associated protein